MKASLKSAGIIIGLLALVLSIMGFYYVEPHSTPATVQAPRVYPILTITCTQCLVFSNPTWSGNWKYYQFILYLHVCAAGTGNLVNSTDYSVPGNGSLTLRFSNVTADLEHFYIGWGVYANYTHTDNPIVFSSLHLSKWNAASDSDCCILQHNSF